MSSVLGPFRTITTDRNAWLIERFFTPEMDRVADATFDRETSGAFTVGGTDVTFSADVDATHQIELVWPSDADAVADLARFGIDLAEGDIGIRVRLLGRASASAAAKVPVGTLTLGFGAEGGGRVEYERFDSYPLTTPILDAVADVLTGLRLPSQVDRVEALPGPHEILTTKLAGYLQLSADMAWGATLANTRGAHLGELALDFQSTVALAATAAATYRLAGHFEIHCCRAGARARFIVRKQRETRFSFAADFALDAAFEMKGLPDSPNEFLGQLLGADVARVLGAIDRLQTFDSLDTVTAAVGEWAADAVSDLATPLIGRALDAGTTRAFLDALRRVSAEYASLDQRVARLYERSVGDVPALTRALDRLAAATQPGALKEVNDSRAWDIFRALAGDRFYDALLDREAFAQVIDVVGRAQDFIANGSPQVKAAIETLQETLPFDRVVRQLRAVSSPEALKALADQQLRTAVALLIGRSFTEIEKKAGPAFTQLQQTLSAIDAFNAQWYDTLADTANAKFKATVNAEFSRASSSDALLDVEIDVSTPAGQRLARRAAVGDFAELLADARLPIVTLREAVLTHAVTRESRLTINVLGFEASRMSRLITSSKDQFQQTDGGLLLVHTVEAKNEKEVRRRNEQTLTRFIFRGAAEALMATGDETRTHMVDTLRSISASYDYRIEDSKTSTRELVEYLGFAGLMGLIDDPGQFVAELQAELPQGWTAVKAEYVIRYDAAAVAAVFGQETVVLLAEARRALTELIGRVLIVPGRPNDARLGLAFLDPATRLAYEQAKPFAPPGAIPVRVPAWVTRDQPRTESLKGAQKELLRGVFNTEANYLDRLARLDRAMDRLMRTPHQVRSPVATRELDKVVTDFVALADDFPTDRKVNPFFGTFDALILHTTPRARRAALVLEITPKGGGVPVTKYLSA